MRKLAALAKVSGTIRLKAIFLALFVLAGPAYAADPSLDGDWDSAISLGGKSSPLVLHLETKDGVVGGMLISSDQANLSSVSQDGNRVTVTITAPPVTIMGTLSADDRIITGEFKVGPTELPLVLTRRSVSAPAPN